jgi:hypothetical protein
MLQHDASKSVTIPCKLAQKLEEKLRQRRCILKIFKPLSSRRLTQNFETMRSMRSMRGGLFSVVEGPKQ